MPSAEEIKARITLSGLVGHYVSLNYRSGEYWGPCPFHEDRTPSFSVNDDKAVYSCFGCGAKGDALDFVQRIEGIDFKGAMEFLSGQNYEKFSTSASAEKPSKLNPASIPDKNREKALKIWKETDPAQGTLAETYLRSRGITIHPPPTLRFHPRLYHAFEGDHFPALVAAVSSGSRVVAVQRIYLSADGQGKAKVESQKLSLGPVKSGSVRLSPIGETLIITEGIEDGLSLLQEHPGLTVWAALGTQNLACQNIPSKTKRLIIGADNDPAGQEAAKAAADYYARNGLQVEIATPRNGKDFNEHLQKRINYEQSCT